MNLHAWVSVFAALHPIGSSSNGMFFVDVTAPDWLALVLTHCKENKKGVEGADGVVDGALACATIGVRMQIIGSAVRKDELYTNGNLMALN